MVLALVGDSTITRASPARRDRRLPSPFPAALVCALGDGCGTFPVARFVLGFALLVLLVAIGLTISSVTHPGVNGARFKKRARFPDSKHKFAKVLYVNVLGPTAGIARNLDHLSSDGVRRFGVRRHLVLRPPV